MVNNLSFIVKIYAFWPSSSLTIRLYTLRCQLFCSTLWQRTMKMDRTLLATFQRSAWC